MTFTWSPAIKEPIESDVFAEKFYDFMKNWVVSGCAPSGVDTGNLTVGTGTCWINGWRVVVTVADVLDISSPDGDRWVYIELTKDGSGKVTSVDLVDYGSSQTEDVRILIANPNVASSVITAVNDSRQYDPFEADLIRLKDDVSLGDWTHGSNHGKIDGAEIYNNSVDTAQIAAGAITNTEVDTSAEIAWSKLNKDGSNLTDIVTRDHGALSGLGDDDHSIYANRTATETISGIWQYNNTIRMLSENNVAFQSGGTSYGHIFAESGTMNIEGLNNGNILIGANANTVRMLNTLIMRSANTIQFNDASQDKAGVMDASGSQRISIELEDGYDLILSAGTSDSVFIGTGVAGYLTIDDTKIVASKRVRPNACDSIESAGTSYRWAKVWSVAGVGTGACADVAEWLPGEEGEPGDVYAIEEDGGMLVLCTKENDPQRIGVYSENPGLELRAMYRHDEDEVNPESKFKETYSNWKTYQVLLSLVGTVITKVIGKVNIGDYLITSETKGHARAVRSDDETPIFTLGRAFDREVGSGSGQVKMLIENKILYHNPVAS